MSKRKYYIVLAIILAIIIALKIPGLFFVSPLTNVVGDETTIIDGALRMINNQSLVVKEIYLYHLAFVYYLYIPVYLVALFFTKIFFHLNLAELREWVILNYGWLLIWGRAFTVLIGAVVVWLTSRITFRIFQDRRISLLAAFLTGFNLFIWQSSQFARVWMAQIFFILLTFDYLIGLFIKKEKLTFWQHILVGLLIGVAFGIHYVGAIVYFSFLLVYFYCFQGKKVQAILSQGFWATNLIILLIIILVALANPAGFDNYTGLVKEFSSGQAEVLGMPFSFWHDMTYYAKALFLYGFWLVTLFLAALPVLYKKSKPFFYLLLSFALPYYFFISYGFGRDEEDRYIGPVVPFLATIGAFGFFWFWDKLKKPYLKYALAAVIFLMYGAFPVYWTILASRESTLLEARHWILSILPSDSKIVEVGVMLDLPENKKTIEEIKKYNPSFYTIGRRLLDSKSPDSFPSPSFWVLHDHYLENVESSYITQNSFEYLVIAGTDNQKKEFLENFDLRGEKIKEFSNGSESNNKNDLQSSMKNPLKLFLQIDRPGPKIEVYRLEGN